MTTVNIQITGLDPIFVTDQSYSISWTLDNLVSSCPDPVVFITPDYDTAILSYEEACCPITGTISAVINHSCFIEPVTKTWPIEDIVCSPAAVFKCSEPVYQDCALDLQLVFDVSGSMANGFEDTTDIITTKLQEYIDSNDRLGIVTFNNAIVDSSSLTTGQANTYTILDNATAGGLTNYTCATSTAVMDLINAPVTGKRCRVLIFITDGGQNACCDSTTPIPGVDTCATSDADTIFAQQIAYAQTQGIDTYAIAFGSLNSQGLSLLTSIFGDTNTVIGNNTNLASLFDYIFNQIQIIEQPECVQSPDGILLSCDDAQCLDLIKYECTAFGCIPSDTGTLSLEDCEACSPGDPSDCIEPISYNITCESVGDETNDISLIFDLGISSDVTVTFASETYQSYWNGTQLVLPYETASGTNGCDTSFVTFNPKAGPIVFTLSDGVCPDKVIEIGPTLFNYDPLTVDPDPYFTCSCYYILEDGVEVYSDSTSCCPPEGVIIGCRAVGTGHIFAPGYECYFYDYLNIPTTLEVDKGNGYIPVTTAADLFAGCDSNNNVTSQVNRVRVSHPDPCFETQEFLIEYPGCTDSVCVAPTCTCVRITNLTTNTVIMEDISGCPPCCPEVIPTFNCITGSGGAGIEITNYQDIEVDYSIEINNGSGWVPAAAGEIMFYSVTQGSLLPRTFRIGNVECGYTEYEITSITQLGDPACDCITVTDITNSIVVFENVTNCFSCDMTVEITSEIVVDCDSFEDHFQDIFYSCDNGIQGLTESSLNYTYQLQPSGPITSIVNGDFLPDGAYIIASQECGAFPTKYLIVGCTDPCDSLNLNLSTMGNVGGFNVGVLSASVGISAYIIDYYLDYGLPSQTLIVTQGLGSLYDSNTMIDSSWPGLYPSPAGNIQPVIRELITSNNSYQDLVCLDFIFVVDTINCANLPFSINYNGQAGISSNDSVELELTGSELYIEINYRFLSVLDTLNVYLNGNLIYTDNSAVNNIIHRLDLTSETFVSGDKLVFEIIGNPDPNLTTIWDLSINKCCYSLICPSLGQPVINYSNLVNCTDSFQVNLSFPDSNLLSEDCKSEYDASFFTIARIKNNTTYPESCLYTQQGRNPSNICPDADVIDVTENSGVITLAFKNSLHYTSFQNQYNILANLCNTSTPLDVEYWSILEILFRDNCGDTYNGSKVPLRPCVDTIVWDDVNEIMTITHSNSSPNGTTCDSHIDTLWASSLSSMSSLPINSVYVHNISRIIPTYVPETTVPGEEAFINYFILPTQDLNCPPEEGCYRLSATDYDDVCNTWVLEQSSNCDGVYDVIINQA